jgi:hypothetical protein
MSSVWCEEGSMVSKRAPAGDSCVQFALFLDYDLAYQELQRGRVIRVSVEGLEHLPDEFKTGPGPLFVRESGGSDETWICASTPVDFVADIGDGALQEMAERDGWKLGGQYRVRVFEQGGELSGEVLCEGGAGATTFNASGFQRARVLKIAGYSLSGPQELIDRQVASLEQAMEGPGRGNRAERRARGAKGVRSTSYDG